MSDSVFDPNLLLDATTTESFTKRPPIPAGTELVGVIGEPKIRQSQGKKDPTKSYIFLDLPIEFDLTQNSDVHNKVGQDKLVIGDSLILDLKDGGAIDAAPGKNVQLRRYREALSLNEPGRPFSFRMLQGQPIRVRIKLDPDPNNSDVFYERISSVAKA
ncbi:MAG: hypothetical protein ACRD22_13705 [Terriglobia bacterium]